MCTLSFRALLSNRPVQAAHHSLLKVTKLLCRGELGLFWNVVVMHCPGRFRVSCLHTRNDHSSVEGRMTYPFRPAATWSRSLVLLPSTTTGKPIVSPDFYGNVDVSIKVMSNH